MFEKFGRDMARCSFLWLPCLRFAESLGFVNWCFSTKSESQGLLKFLENRDKYFGLHSVSVALLPTILSPVSCLPFSKYDAWVHASQLLLLLWFLLETTSLPTLYQHTPMPLSHWSSVQRSPYLWRFPTKALVMCVVAPSPLLAICFLSLSFCSNTWNTSL